MTESVTGGRMQFFTYNPGETQPAQVVTASNKVIKYEYELQLGDEPRRRRIPGKAPAEYIRDGKNARLLTCKEDDVELVRTYFSTGELKSEARIQGAAQPYTMHYDYSRQGNLLSYTDVLNEVQYYDYHDTNNQLKQTRLGTTVADFTYDSLGQPLTISTQDGTSGQYVTISLKHDGLGREIKRIFDLNGVLQVLTQVYDARDALVGRTLREGKIILRKETFVYDPRGRLVHYTCKGTRPPEDPYGNKILSQTFRLDNLDNIIRVVTTYPGPNGTVSTNVAEYKYTGVDPVQMTEVTNTPPGNGYPAVIRLKYDADGRMVEDEEGRILDYDPIGRLIQVSNASGGSSKSYGYSGLDELIIDDGDGGSQQRFYQDGELANLVQDKGSSTFVRGAGVVLAEHQEGAGPKP